MTYHSKTENAQFIDTVQKLASSPTKLAMLGKQAGDAGAISAVANILAGNLKAGAIPALKHLLISGALITGATAGGIVLRNLIQEVVKGRFEQSKNVDATKGRLQAQLQFQQEQAAKLRPLQTSVFKKVIKNDEILQDANKDELRASFSTMQRFAPNLAADPNAVRSFLRESAAYGTGPNYATIKNLAEAERAVTNAGKL